MPDYPTQDDLKELPLRAIVALAARCARRLQPLYKLREGHPWRAKYFRAIARAIQMAEAYARMDDSVSAADAADAADNAREAAQAIPLAHFAHESDGPNTERRPARAAAYAATEAASAACAALNATPDGASVARYAAEAILAAHTAYVPPEVATYDSAIAADYDRLLGGDLGTFPEPGGPIDASESGPLGTLWPSEVPERYAVGLEHMRIALAGADAPPSAGGASGEPAWLPSFDIYIGPGSASTETIQEVLEALSDLHRAAGGLGLEFKVEGQHVLAKMEVTP